MFIELAEYLRCPADHEETYCVVSAEEMQDRRVVSGAVGCPVCHAQYPLRDGVVEFGVDPLLGPASRADDLTVERTTDPAVLHPLLGLSSPGGFVVMLGSAVRCAEGLAALVDGVHIVGVNPPPDLCESARVSLVRSTKSIPLRSAVARGVVLGTEYVGTTWLDEGVRVLLRGQRLVAMSDHAAARRLERLAASGGLWVGRKTA